MTASVSTEEHFLYLFFGPDAESQRKGRESLSRLEPRLSKSRAEVTQEAWGRQLQAIMTRWAGGDGSAWSRLQEITIPVLVANGAHDVMVDASDSFAMVRRDEERHGTVLWRCRPRLPIPASRRVRESRP